MGNQRTTAGLRQHKATARNSAHRDYVPETVSADLLYWLLTALGTRAGPVGKDARPCPVSLVLSHRSWPRLSCPALDVLAVVSRLICSVSTVSRGGLVLAQARQLFVDSP